MEPNLVLARVRSGAVSVCRLSTLCSDVLTEPQRERNRTHSLSHDTGTYRENTLFICQKSMATSRIFKNHIL